MAREPGEWVPSDEERHVIREAILRDRPDLAGNETALLLAEERVISWVRQREAEDDAY